MSTASCTGNFAALLYFPLRLIHLLHALLLKIFPPPSNFKRTDNIYVETMGLAGLFLFLLNINLVWDLHRNAETMLIIAFFLAIGHWWGVLIRQPLFWLMIAFAASLIISALVGNLNFPQHTHINEAKSMARFCLYVGLAWWIGTSFTSIRNSFLIVCLGFVLSSLPWMLDWKIMVELFGGVRPGIDVLGMGTARYGTWIGFLLIGTIVLGKNYLPGSLWSSRYYYAGYAIFLIMTIIMAAGVFVIASRTIWIALAVAIPLGIVTYFLLSGQHRKLSWKNLAIPMIVLILISFFTVTQLDRIQERFSLESENLNYLVSGQFHQVERTFDQGGESALGVRIQMYMWSLENKAFATPFGWGLRSLRAINNNEELREKYNWHFGHSHFHSDFFMLSFQLGLFGISVIFLILFFLIKGVVTGYQKKDISEHWLIFCLMTTLYVLIVGLTNSNFMTHAFLPVWAGLIFAIGLRSFPNVHAELENNN